MAVEIETKGQLLEFLDVLKKRSWQVILPAAFMITLGVAAGVLIPKKYLVQTQIELRPVGMSVSSKEGGNAPFQILARERIKKVIESLGNTDYLALPPEERPQFVADVQSNVKVTLNRNDNQGSTFVTISYADVQPQWAVDFLRALREDWIHDVLERDRNKLDDERERLREQKQILEGQVKKEDDALTDLKREHGISATQPILGVQAPRDEHPAYVRLQLTNTRLDEIELDVAKLRVTIAALETHYAALPEKLTREELVAGVDNERALKEVQLQILDLQQSMIGIGRAHSKFRQTTDKIHTLEDRQEQLTRLVTKSQSQEVAVPNLEREKIPEEIEVGKRELAGLEAEQAVLQAKKAEDEQAVHRLHAIYQQLSEKSDKVARLRLSLDDTERRYQEKNQQVVIIAGPLANPFEITEEVTPPIHPTEPNPWLIIAFSVAAGFGLGIGLAVFLEYTKNCFRSPHDITRVMVIPVLGTINSITTRREARVRTARRTAVGLSSAVFIASIVFVTWAWQNHPTLLSQELRDTIEDLRSKFR